MNNAQSNEAINHYFRRLAFCAQLHCTRDTFRSEYITHLYRDFLPPKFFNNFALTVTCTYEYSWDVFLRKMKTSVVNKIKINS